MNKKWLTPYIKYEPCKIRRVGAKRKWFIFSPPTKDGFELKDNLAYWDGDIMWVLHPGYLWDGSSYPSSKTVLGKLLRQLVGNRMKFGLLASSAQHDQMYIRSRELKMFYCSKEELPEWELAIKESRFEDFIKDKPKKPVYLTIRTAATKYRKMILAWPESNQSIAKRKARRQYVGLLLFQPIYKLINPTNVPWERVGVINIKKR